MASQRGDDRAKRDDGAGAGGAMGAHQAPPARAEHDLPTTSPSERLDRTRPTSSRRSLQERAEPHRQIDRDIDVSRCLRSDRRGVQPFDPGLAQGDGIGRPQQGPPTGRSPAAMLSRPRRIRQVRGSLS